MSAGMQAKTEVGRLDPTTRKVWQTVPDGLVTVTLHICNVE